MYVPIDRTNGWHPRLVSETFTHNFDVVMISWNDAVRQIQRLHKCPKPFVFFDSAKVGQVT